MIILHQPPPVWGIPNMSPFCLKLETYLRMAGHEYKAVWKGPMGAPKGKIPWVEVDGQIIGDSSLIINYLKKNHGDPLDQHLTPTQRAQGLAIQCLVEEHMYFGGAWLRWNTPDSWAHVRKVFLSMMPPIIGGFIVRKIHKDFTRAIYAQGMGRHTREEILEFVLKDLTALSVLLGEQPFFLGEKPTSVDACVYGMLVQQLCTPWPSPVKDHARSLPNLVAFEQRMKERFWKAGPT